MVTSEIHVETYRLEQYAARLAAVNSRISRIDLQMDSLYTKVGLKGLKSLIKADILTGYNQKLRRCQKYLSQTAADFEKVERELNKYDPLSFQKPVGTVRASVAKAVYNVGAAVKKSADKVTSLVKKTVGDLAASYYSQGTVYRAVQYGKAILSGAKGVSKVVAGVVSIVGTGGLSTPVAVLSVISGANDIYNAMTDGAYIYTEQYDKIGQNALKDTLVDSGEQLGRAIGNEKLGTIIGNTTYYGIDIVTSLASLELSWDKVIQSDPTKLGEMGGELKQLAGLDVSGILTTDIQELRYQAKLLSYTFKQTGNFISNVGAIAGAVDDSVDVARGLVDIVNDSFDIDTKNPVLEAYDKITGLGKAVSGGAKLATWDYEGLTGTAERLGSQIFSRKGCLLCKDSPFKSNLSGFTSELKDLKDTFVSTFKGAKELFD